MNPALGNCSTGPRRPPGTSRPVAGASAGRHAAGGPGAAGWERTARGEVHDRPMVRDLVAVVARSTAAPAGLARLAATLQVT